MKTQTNSAAQLQIIANLECELGVDSSYDVHELMSKAAAEIKALRSRIDLLQQR